jgi:CheY-like chemotaxis protein
MKILLVEDDHFQVEDICEELEASFPGVEVETLDSENAFYVRLERLEEDTPDVIIMDVMVRWTRPSPDMPPAPPEVDKEMYYRAGFRCIKRLAEHKEAKRINVILYTVLEIGDIRAELDALPMSVTYLAKEAGYSKFIRAIRSFNINR